jgi:hypothetical protein
MARFALKNQGKVSAGKEQQSRPFQKGVMMTVLLMLAGSFPPVTG